MFPLKTKKLIRGCQAHINAGLGCGCDYSASYVPFYVPFDGRATTFEDDKGGNWWELIRPNGDRIALAHLSQRTLVGDVKEGQQAGVTGNTGSLTSGAHLHLQIKNKNGTRLDPELYAWGEGDDVNLNEIFKGMKTHKDSEKSSAVFIQIPNEEVWKEINNARLDYVYKYPEKIISLSVLLGKCKEQSTITEDANISLQKALDNCHKTSDGFSDDLITCQSDLTKCSEGFKENLDDYKWQSLVQALGRKIITYFEGFKK